MTFEKTLDWEAGMQVDFTFTEELGLVSWKLWSDFIEIVPNRESADEINIMLEKWLAKEYNNISWYADEVLNKYVEQNYEAMQGR